MDVLKIEKFLAVGAGNGYGNGYGTGCGNSRGSSNGNGNGIRELKGAY